ncbi:methyltransferase domain-containing protein [Wenyingzhuangia sp. IMCC45533]
MIDKLDAQYWNNRYLEQSHRWDLGAISLPLKTYINQLEDKEIKILIPGGGNSYEAEYLFNRGFKNVYVVDLAEEPLRNIQQRVSAFPKEQLIHGDFFELNQTFDLVLEQTFFCALNPNLREAYLSKMKEMIRPNGKLVGLFFDAALNDDKPPFGGSKLVYQQKFGTYFIIQKIETCYNSHSTRQGRELFVILTN